MILKAMLCSLLIQTINVQFPVLTHFFLFLALVLLNKVMGNKPFYFHFLSRYKEYNAITTQKYDPKTIQIRILLCTMKKKTKVGMQDLRLNPINMGYPFSFLPKKAFKQKSSFSF